MTMLMMNTLKSQSRSRPPSDQHPRHLPQNHPKNQGWSGSHCMILSKITRRRIKDSKIWTISAVAIRENTRFCQSLGTRKTRTTLLSRWRQASSRRPFRRMTLSRRTLIPYSTTTRRTSSSLAASDHSSSTHTHQYSLYLVNLMRFTLKLERERSCTPF